MKIDLDYIKNLSDEDIHKLNRQQIIRRLKTANRLAIDRRTEALQYLEENPDTPTPLVYKNYTKTVRPKHGEIDWRNYEFEFENRESLKDLKNKLKDVRQFLKSKTSEIQGWLNSLQEFSLKLAKKLKIDVDLNELKGVKYKRLWRVYNKIRELNINIGTEYQDSKQLQGLIYQAMTDADFQIEKFGIKTSSYGVDRLTDVLEMFLKDEYEKPPTKEEKSKAESAYSGLGKQF